MQLLIKMSLSNALQLRVLKGFLLDAFIVPIENSIMAAATQKRHAMAEELRESLVGRSKTDIAKRINFEIALAHHVAWQSIMHWAFSQQSVNVPQDSASSGNTGAGQDSSHVNPSMKALQQHGAQMAAWVSSKDWRSFQADVRLVRAERTYNNKQGTKILFRIRPNTLAYSAYTVMIPLVAGQPNTRALPPQAPPEDMERQLQQLLQGMGEHSSEVDSSMTVINIEGVVTAL